MVVKIRSSWCFGGGVDVRPQLAEIAAVVEQTGDQIFQRGRCLADRCGEVRVGEEAHEVGDVDEVAIASFLVEGQQFEQHAADELAHGRRVAEGQAFAGAPFGVGVEDAQRAEWFGGRRAPFAWWSTTAMPGCRGGCQAASGRGWCATW